MKLEPLTKEKGLLAYHPKKVKGTSHFGHMHTSFLENDVRSAYLWAVEKIETCVDYDDEGVKDKMSLRDVREILKKAFEAVADE